MMIGRPNDLKPVLLKSRLYLSTYLIEFVSRFHIHISLRKLYSLCVFVFVIVWHIINGLLESFVYVKPYDT